MVVDSRMLYGVLVASAGLVVIGPVWRLTRYAVTAVHEFGHLVVALAVGGRGARVRLRADTSGLTTWRTTRDGRARSGLVALSGPAMPPLVGAGCAFAFTTGRAPYGVFGLAALVAVISVVVRNVWGLIVCMALGAICWAAWRYGTSAAEVLMVVSATVLCLGGIRSVAEEMSSRQPGGVSDTQVASSALWLPATMWGIVLLSWALACTGWATWQLAATF